MSFCKGTVAKVISGEEATQTLRELKTAAAAHVARQKETRHIIQKGGVLYAKDARDKIAQKRLNNIKSLRRQQMANRRPRNRRVAFKRGIK